MIEISTVLRYDAVDGRATRKGFVPWWSVAQASKGLYDLYASFLQKSENVSIILPLWLPHLTLTRGEKPRHERCWRKYEGRRFSVFYNPEKLVINNKYVFFPAESPDLESVRRELGLSSQPRTPFHLTIGNTKNLGTLKKKKFDAQIFPWERYLADKFDTRNYKNNE